MNLLSRDFYARDTLVVAGELLGKCVVRRTSKGSVVAKIVEVEAYKGKEDPASHAYRGMTPRNHLMFGEGGFAYVYFIYGNHYCLNITTERVGVPGAVLVRAVEIQHGTELARQNRKVKSLTKLTNGPGKLTQALKITKRQNGLDLTKLGDLFIIPQDHDEDFETVTTDRVGIKAGAKKPWRFYIKGNKFVSKP